MNDGKRTKAAIAKAVAQAGGDEQRARAIFKDMCEREQFLRWEFEEKSWSAFIDGLVTEIAGRLYPGKETFTREEADAIHAEVEKRRLAGWEKQEEAACPLSYRELTGGSTEMTRGSYGAKITGRMLVRLMIEEAERLEEKSALSPEDALIVVERSTATVTMLSPRTPRASFACSSRATRGSIKMSVTYLWVFVGVLK